MTYTGNAADVFALADYVSDIRMNAKTLAVLTGAAIAALDLTPTSRYNFEGNGNDVVGSNNLTAFGSPAYADGGPFGSYVDFGSSNSTKYFEAATNAVLDIGTGDFSFWGVIYTQATGVEQRIVNKTSGTAGYAVAVFSNNKLRLSITAASVVVTIDTLSDVSVNTWYFWLISATRAGSGVVYLYNMGTGAFDSNSASLATVTGTLTNGQKFTVGRNSAAASQYVSGYCDHINALIGTAVSLAQVLIIIGSLRPGMTVKCSKTENGFVKENVYQRNIESSRWSPNSVFRGTGADIAALATNKMTYPGLLAYCTSTGSGFTVDTSYKRNSADSSWDGVVDNTTITGPTLAGTVAGTPTFSGAFATSGTPKIDNAEDVKVISTPADPAAGYLRLYGKQFDANNDAPHVKTKLMGTVREVPLLAPLGNFLFHSNDTSRQTTSASMAKIKESTSSYSGVIRVKYDYSTTGSGAVTYSFQLYVNGVAVGGLVSGGTISGTRSDDIYVNAGDLVQVYASVSSQSGGPNNAVVQNFRFYIGNMVAGTATGGF